MVTNKERRSTTRNSIHALPLEVALEKRLRLAEVISFTGWGRTQIYRLMKAGGFPQPQRNGSRSSRWRLGDVIEFLRRKDSHE